MCVCYNKSMSRNKYTKELLQIAVDNSLSFAGVLRNLGLKQAGGTQSHITAMIRRNSIDTSHFTGSRWNKGREQPHLRRSANDILVLLPNGSNRTKTYQLRRAMTESGVLYSCAECSTGNEWNNRELVLEVDHVDGDSLNNRINNLRFLCPNCHSQQKDTNRPHKYAGVVER